MTAILFTLLFVFAGCAIVQFQLPRKNPIVRLWLGASLGMLLLMVLPALCAHVLAFSVKAHCAAAALLMALVALSYALRDKRDMAAMTAWDERFLWALLLVVVPLTALSAYLQVTHMVQIAPDGSYWCGQSTYGDLCMHMAFATSMRDMAFPPTYNLLAGTALSYPYLIDSLSTTMLLFGMEIQGALVFPGTIMMALTYVGYMILAREILGNRRLAVIAAALMFFLNGGLGFLYDFDLMGRDGFMKIREIFTGYYKTPANQPDVNLRWSNVIADLLVPQRALMGGWAMGVPALYLLLSSSKARSMRQTLLLALWASCLPLVHTHTFLALGLFSGGYILGRLLTHREDWKNILARAGVYLAIVLALALPQLLGNAIRQTVEGGVMRIQFNWVNNPGGWGMRDFYLWFYVKNIGLPFIALLLAICERNPKHRRIFAGAFVIILAAETIRFQPNEYDNNKLLYLAWMLCCMIVADWCAMMWQRLKGLRARLVIAVALAVVTFLSAGLTLWRECLSDYQAFSARSVEAGTFVRDETEEDAMFLTGVHHLNPVTSIGGRRIVCGPDLWLYYHGFDTTERKQDIARFYADPAGNTDVLTKYDVDYIFVSSYERNDYWVDEDALCDMYEVVFDNPEATVWRVPEG